MVYDSSHNNPWDAAKERFVGLEENFIDISHNMNLLMVALTNKFRPSGEVGASNLEVGIR
jgi:hypothetical protein